MTQSFEEVFENNYGFYIDDSCKHRYANSKEFGKAMYESGQQSQQAKIDELQGRIDGVLSHLDSAYPESWGCCVEQAINILKGNKDETIIRIN